MDGYCPLAVYLGTQGYCLDLSLRPGVQHSACDTHLDFKRIVPRAQRLSAHSTRAPILVRLDSGFDSAQLMGELAACNTAGLPRVDWLIKWNPRKAEAATLAALLQANETTRWQHPRPGKRVTVWDEQVRIEGFERAQRRVMRLTERTIDAKGQRLEPQFVLEG